MNIIYIKAVKKVVIEGKHIITIGDIVEIEGEEKLVNKLKKLELIKINKKKKKNILISFIDIAKVINKYYSGINICNVGETDIIISYYPCKQKQNKLWTVVKVIFVCCILICGAAIAIMTFHTDAAVPNVFITINKIFTGKQIEKPFAIIIPYSIGLAVGIIVFYNHFSSKKLTDDPTPIEVELRTYEKSVEDCLIETLTSNKGAEDD